MVYSLFFTVFPLICISVAFTCLIGEGLSKRHYERLGRNLTIQRAAEAELLAVLKPEDRAWLSAHGWRDPDKSITRVYKDGRVLTKCPVCGKFHAGLCKPAPPPPHAVEPAVLSTMDNRELRVHKDFLMERFRRADDADRIDLMHALAGELERVHYAERARGIGARALQQPLPRPAMCRAEQHVWTAAGLCAFCDAHH